MIRRFAQPRRPRHLTGTHFATLGASGNGELATIGGVGYGFSIETVNPNDSASWDARLDAATAAGIRLIIGGYPEPYTWNGTNWTISANGISMLNYFESRESETLGLFCFNEPFLTKDVSAEQLRIFRDDIHAVWPGAKIYHDQSDPRFWAAANPSKWGDQSDTADILGYWYYPFRTGGYDPTTAIAEVISLTDFVVDNVGAIPCFDAQSHSYAPDNLVYPSNANILDWNNRIRKVLPPHAFISWYPWEFSYADVLRDFPTQWPLTI